MEKDKNKLEKNDDSSDENEDDDIDVDTDDTKQTSRKIETIKHYSKETQEQKITKHKESKFFQKNETSKEEVSDDYSGNGEQTASDEEPGLSEEELHEATLAIVDSLKQEVAEELNNAVPDSSEEFEALADAVFLDELLDIAISDKNITTEDINQAHNEALVDIGIDSNEEVPDAHNEEIEEQVENSNQNSIEDLVADEDTETQFSLNSDTEVQSTTESAVNVSTAVPNNLSSLSVNQSINQPNTVIKTITKTKNVEIIHGRRSDMLVGSIIGYIVGRRGGRKRAEKKLQPKINRLEEQVTELHYKIINKEAQIRTLARQKAEIIKNNKTESNNKSLSEEVIEQRKIKKDVREKLKRREELSKDPGVEKIGKFSLPALKVFHERRIPDGSENSPKRKQVEVMNERELLEQIGDLRIEGYGVKELYVNGRLELKSLRQITKEYLRGGPYKQTFIRELLRDKNEIERSRKVVKTLNSEISAHENSSSDISKSNSETITREEAIKKAEALLMTHTETTSKPKSNKALVASFTLLIVMVCVFIILLLS